MLSHFPSSDKNNIHIILFTILSSSLTMHLKVSCLSFSLFWWVCLYLYLCLHSFDILFLHPNLVHSARYFPSKYYIIPFFSFLFRICQSHQHFKHPVCSTCKVLHSNFALLQNTVHLLFSQPSSYIAAPFRAPSGDLRGFLQNIPCIL